MILLLLQLRATTIFDCVVVIVPCSTHVCTTTAMPCMPIVVFIFSRLASLCHRQLYLPVDGTYTDIAQEIGLCQQRESTCPDHTHPRMGRQSYTRSKGTTYPPLILFSPSFQSPIPSTRFGSVPTLPRTRGSPLSLSWSAQTSVHLGNPS